MKNKIGKADRILVFVVIAVAVIAAIYLILESDLFAVQNGAADISKEEKGTGLFLKLYDIDGNEIDIPDWLIAELFPGDPIESWITTTKMLLSDWEGTVQNFSVEVSATNEYTKEIVKSSDSIQLVFDADPTGALIVKVVSPI